MRQACGVSQSLCMSVGMLLAFIFGYFIQTWRMVSGVIGIIPLTSMLLQLLLPETPYWLIEKGRDKEARYKVG